MTLQSISTSICAETVKWRKRVNRLIAITWLGPIPAGCEVCHGPNGSEDNSVDNLCYGNKEDNARDKVRDNTVYNRRVRRSDNIEFDSVKQAEEFSDKMGIPAANIPAACRGRIKTSGGYGWSYI